MSHLPLADTIRPRHKSIGPEKTNRQQGPTTPVDPTPEPPDPKQRQESLDEPKYRKPKAPRSPGEHTSGLQQSRKQPPVTAKQQREQGTEQRPDLEAPETPQEPVGESETPESSETPSKPPKAVETKPEAPETPTPQESPPTAQKPQQPPQEIAEPDVEEPTSESPETRQGKLSRKERGLRSGQDRTKKKIMYRGVGEGSDVSSGFEWYSQTPKLAERYADYRKGKIQTAEIEVTNPFRISNPRQVLNAHSFFANAVRSLDVRNVDQQKVREAHSAFLQIFGENDREIQDYWSSPEAKEATRQLLESLGYDSIEMEEGGEITVAVLRNDQKKQEERELRSEQPEYPGLPDLTPEQQAALGRAVPPSKQGEQETPPQERDDFTETEVWGPGNEQYQAAIDDHPVIAKRNEYRGLARQGTEDSVTAEVLADLLMQEDILPDQTTIDTLRKTMSSLPEDSPAREGAEAKLEKYQQSIDADKKFVIKDTATFLSTAFPNNAMASTWTTPPLSYDGMVTVPIEGEEVFFRDANGGLLARGIVRKNGVRETPEGMQLDLDMQQIGGGQDIVRDDSQIRAYQYGYTHPTDDFNFPDWITRNVQNRGQAERFIYDLSENMNITPEELRQRYGDDVPVSYAASSNTRIINQYVDLLEEGFTPNDVRSLRNGQRDSWELKPLRPDFGYDEETNRTLWANRVHYNVYGAHHGGLNELDMSYDVVDLSGGRNDTPLRQDRLTSHSSSEKWIHTVADAVYPEWAEYIERGGDASLEAFNQFVVDWTKRTFPVDEHPYDGIVKVLNETGNPHGITSNAGLHNWKERAEFAKQFNADELIQAPDYLFEITRRKQAGNFRETTNRDSDNVIQSTAWVRSHAPIANALGTFNIQDDLSREILRRIKIYREMTDEQKESPEGRELAKVVRAYEQRAKAADLMRTPTPQRGDEIVEEEILDVLPGDEEGEFGGPTVARSNYSPENLEDLPEVLPADELDFGDASDDNLIDLPPEDEGFDFGTRDIDPMASTPRLQLADTLSEQSISSPDANAFFADIPNIPPGTPKSTSQADIARRKVSSVFDSALEESNVPVENRESYAKSMQRALRDMPQKVLDDIYENIKNIKWQSSPQEVTQQFNEHYNRGVPPDQQVWVRPGDYVFGFVDGFGENVYDDAGEFIEPTIVIDGDDASVSPKVRLDDITDVSSTDRRAEIYAHELAHVVDKGYRYSNSLAWTEIWLAEINYPQNATPPLTRYAATSAREGFAEFCRLLYGTNADKKEAKQLFPRAFAFFEKHGLWGNGKETGDVSTEERGEETDRGINPMVNEGGRDYSKYSIAVDEESGDYVLENNGDDVGSMSLSPPSSSGNESRVSRNLFPQIDFADDATFSRIHGVEIDEQYRGQGLGQYLYLNAMQQNGADWFYNSQTSADATNIYKALEKKGFLEVYWREGEPDWNEEGGVHLARLTDAGRDFVNNKKDAVNQDESIYDAEVIEDEPIYDAEIIEDESIYDAEIIEDEPIYDAEIIEDSRQSIDLPPEYEQGDNGVVVNKQTGRKYLPDESFDPDDVDDENTPSPMMTYSEENEGNESILTKPVSRTDLTSSDRSTIEGDDRITVDIPEDVQGDLDELFPDRKITPGQLARLAGAFPGAKVEAKWLDGVFLKVKQDGVYSQSRTIDYDPVKNEPYLHIDLTDIPEELQGSGMGTHIFAKQVREALALGLKSIRNSSARQDPELIGYKVWPKFGYDAALSPERIKKLPPHLKSAKSIQDLYELPGGKEYWEEKGNTFKGYFDLKPGSNSLRIFNKYLAKKNLPPVESDEWDWMENPASVASLPDLPESSKDDLVNLPNLDFGDDETKNKSFNIRRKERLQWMEKSLSSTKSSTLAESRQTGWLTTVGPTTLKQKTHLRKK